VAISTVSRVLNDHPDVSEETREKVLRAVKELHYIPNTSARNLVRTSSDTIALLVKGVNNPFFAKLIKVIDREITQRGYTLELHHMDTSEDELRVGAQLTNERKLIGICSLAAGSTILRKKWRSSMYQVCFAPIQTPLARSTRGLTAPSRSTISKPRGTRLRRSLRLVIERSQF
jgi:DNA-binding LacI/PurR family transcriptional regulator